MRINGTFEPEMEFRYAITEYNRIDLFCIPVVGEVTNAILEDGSIDTIWRIYQIDASSSAYWFADEDGNGRQWGRFREKLVRLFPNSNWEGTLQQNVYDPVRLRSWCQQVTAKAEEIWPRCEWCGLSGCEADQQEDHSECLGCGNFREAAQMRLLITIHSPIELCAQCYNHPNRADFYECGACYTYAPIDDTQQIQGNRYCDQCVETVFFDCDECGDINRRDQAVEIPGGVICDDCAESQGIYGDINEWDYRPDLIFHPLVPENPKKPMYIGMEIESSFDFSIYQNGVCSPRLRTWLGALDEDLIYVKDDSSVSNGFEIVTHPMAPRWALEHFPFDQFDALLEMGALETHDSCGTHIHINKESFTTAHLWKFLQIHFRLAEFCKVAGGREDSNYASFGARDMGLQRKALMSIVKKKGQAIHDYDRYVAVNLRNEYTIELRYMRGGVRADEIRKNIEWALALYEFSDYLDIKDVRDGALDDTGYLLGWINDGDYPFLSKWLADRVPQAKPLAARST